MYKSRGRNLCSGFTIVELSLVVLVMAVLAGLIAQGLSMYKNSKIRSVITEIDEYKQQVILFYTQYNAYPGDWANASTFWQAFCGGVNCNGNGDGYIDFNTTNLNNNEAWRAWQHISLANIGSNGLKGYGSGNVSVISANIQGSKYGANFGYEFRTYSTTSQKYTTMELYNISSGTTRTGMLCSDIYEIDSKIDDGSPRMGNILVADSTQSGSTASQCYNTSTNAYITNNKTSNGGLQAIIVQGTLHPQYY